MELSQEADFALGREEESDSVHTSGSSDSSSSSESGEDSEEIDDSELLEEDEAVWAGPVYEGSRMTVSAMCVALMRLGGKNKVSYVAMKDLFNMQRLWFLPKTNRFPSYAMTRKLLIRSVSKYLKNVTNPPVYDSCPCGKTCYRNPPLRFDPRLERQFKDRTDCLFCDAPR